jgi:hypothetical protein
MGNPASAGFFMSGYLTSPKPPDILLVSKHETNMDYPTTRKQALATGLDYFTGKPCSRGHIAFRKPKGTCVECMRENWTQENAKRSLKPKSEASRAAGRRYYERNKSAVIDRAQTRTTEAKQHYRRKHKERNPDLYRELVNVRRRRFRQATPTWLTAEDKMEIRLKYRLAIELTRATGTRYAVDHIIPLQGDEVSGLHVPWNLQAIPQETNLKKSNRLDNCHMKAFNHSTGITGVPDRPG